MLLGRTIILTIYMFVYAYFQCLATFAVFIISAGVGQPIGFSAILLPQLYVENSTMQIDAEMGSWIGKKILLSIFKT